MSKRMFGLFAASMLVLAACADGNDGSVQGEDGSEELEHRSGPRRGDGPRCGERAGSDHRGGGNGERADPRSEQEHRRRCDDDSAPHHDAGSGGRVDAGHPRPARDAGSIDATRDAGTRPPARDAGGPVVVPPRDPSVGPGGPVVVDNPDVIKLPDGSTVRLDRSCPSYPTPVSVTLPGCCLPSGSCGLSTHELDVAGVPKGCFSYDQGKMLDPSFNLPEKRCTVR